MSQAIRITRCSVLLSWLAVANFFLRSAFCSRGEARRELLEPAVDRCPVDVLLDVAALVEQRDDGLVLDGLGDRVGVDQAAETCESCSSPA